MTLMQRFLRRVPPRHTLRSFGIKTREEDFMKSEPIPEGHTLDAVKPPDWFSTSGPSRPKDPMAHVRQPVTSAHRIVDHQVSARDSVSVGPSGSLVHGRYGDLGMQEGIPLEYLALLRPAAEGAAATAKLGHQGTLLVFGATQAAGLASVQLWKGKAVVAVVGGEHSGEEEMMSIVKGLTKEPGFAVAEEYALVKKSFANMVESAVKGESMPPAQPETYLSDFKKNLLDYARAYPETRPAAVSESHLEFYGKDKDRDTFRDNMDAYLAQFPSGSPPIDPSKLEQYFTTEQYEVFKARFAQQTTAVITGDDVGDFNPGQIVSSMVMSPVSSSIKTGEIPFEFTLTRNDWYMPCEPAGPIAGAIICVTPDLELSAKAVHDAKGGIRAKAEALQFLTAAQRNAYAAASSVAGLATKAGKPVLVVGGSLPGYESAEPTDEHVQEALKAMEIDDDGTSRLNFFIQVFRAGDYPIYEDYAVHREAQGSPLQIIVTK